MKKHDTYYKGKNNIWIWVIIILILAGLIYAYDIGGVQSFIKERNPFIQQNNPEKIGDNIPPTSETTITLDSIKDISSNPSNYLGEIVSIRGEPIGYADIGTISEYMIADSEGFVFCVETKRRLKENEKYTFTGEVKRIDMYGGAAYYEYCLVEN